MAGEKPDDGDDIVYLYGQDGWPLGPSDPPYMNATAKARLTHDLEAALERLRGGDQRAFPEAIRLYWQQHPEFPYELVEASEASAEAAMAEDEKRARREWRIALTRWEALTELLARRQGVFRTGKATLKRARQLILSKATDAEERTCLVELLPKLIEVADDDRVMSTEGAQEAVSEALENTEAKGTASAIKYSYELIEAAGGENATFESYQEELRRRNELRRRAKERRG
jgi:hypothetical protein